MRLQSLFQNTFILRRPRVDNFAGIIKIATTFIKTIFLFINKIYICISSKVADFQQKRADVSRIHDVSHVMYIFFGSSLGRV